MQLKNRAVHLDKRDEAMELIRSNNRLKALNNNRSPIKRRPPHQPIQREYNPGVRLYLKGLKK